MNNILGLLNDNELKYIEIRKYNKNEIIFSEGLLCNYIGIIIHGNIVISTITNNYKEEIINSITDNQIFGNNLIFSSSPYFLGNIIALNNCEIAFISKTN